MKISDFIVVENLYDWLPSEGESNISFNYADNNVTIEVEYCDRNDTEVRLKRNLVFDRVSYFFKGSIPGPDFLSFQFGEEKLDVGSLVEIKSSEFAEKYSKYFENNVGAKLFTWKHYFVSFTEENMIFHIFSTGVSVSEIMEVEH